MDPDDLESPPRFMWVVLHARPDAPASGYAVVYDPRDSRWGIAERRAGAGFVLVVSADTLACALASM